jgi:IPT/TIG domain-containing protein/FG-GAP repeat protein
MLSPSGAVQSARGQAALHGSGGRARGAVPVRRVFAAAALALTLGLALSFGVANRRSLPVAPAPDAAPGLAQLGLPYPLQGRVSAAPGEGALGYRVEGGAGSFQATNRAQRLGVSFDRAGVRLRAGGAHLLLGVRAAGYGSALATLPGVSPAASANRVTYTRAGLSEWYRNGPRGLEQGFTIERAPAGHPTGPFTLWLALSSDMRPSLARGAQELTLARAGAPSLSYTGLRAEDATGKRLHAWLELRPRALLLMVDTPGARYPLRIDPWVQQVEALPGSSFGQFGFSLALSSDGNTALVGAPQQQGGEGSDKKDGVAYAFARSGSTWNLQQGSPTSRGTVATAAGFAGGSFGESVALSGDGKTALIGSPESRSGAGLAWVFTRMGSTWGQPDRLVNNSSERQRRFGAQVALASDANTAVISAEGLEGETAEVVFTRSGSTWSAQQRLEGVRGAVALSSDGSTLLIGGTVFARSGSTWTQQGGKLVGAGQIGSADFGAGVALSADGNTALIGGPEDNKCNACPHSSVGAAWVFTRSGSTWTQQGGKLTATGGHVEGHFGEGVALSADGNTALIGAPGNGKLEPLEPGSAFVFTRSGSSWTERRQLTPSGSRWQTELENGPPEFGITVALSASGRTALVGANDFEGGWASVFANPPTVTTVTPAAGARSGGTAATISGTDFGEATAVRFGSANAASFKVSSDNSITAVAPAGIGTVDVTVALPDPGASAPSPADEFSYEGEPQLGRCVATARGKGASKNAQCSKPARRGKYAWLAGPGATGKYTSNLKAPAFESTGVGKLLIACAAGKAQGEYTGAHALEVTKLVFSGCAESPAKGLASDCQTTGAANGEIVANELKGDLGLISQGKNPAVGVDLKPASGSALASFECGGASAGTLKGTGAGTPRELVGSVIGKVANTNHMTTSNEVLYEASGGHQLPEHFEGGLNDTLTTLAGLEEMPEPTTFSAREEVATAEALEINAVV